MNALTDSCDDAHWHVLGAGAMGCLWAARMWQHAPLQGRVALLLSDHIWLWGRGHDGGGPQEELLRRIAHWLMRETTLEEIGRAHV